MEQVGDFDKKLDVSEPSEGRGGPLGPNLIQEGKYSFLAIRSCEQALVRLQVLDTDSFAGAASRSFQALVFLSGK